MDGLTEKLNKEYEIKMQGGSLLVILKLLIDKLAGMSIALDLAEQIGVEVDPGEMKHLEELARAVDAIGHNLTADAVKIFGRDYIDKVLSGDTGPGVGGIEEVEVAPDGATIN